MKTVMFFVHNFITCSIVSVNYTDAFDDNDPHHSPFIVSMFIIMCSYDSAIIFLSLAQQSYQ